MDRCRVGAGRGKLFDIRIKVEVRNQRGVLAQVAAAIAEAGSNIETSMWRWIPTPRVCTRCSDSPSRWPTGSTWHRDARLRHIPEVTRISRERGAKFEVLVLARCRRHDQRLVSRSVGAVRSSSSTASRWPATKPVSPTAARFPSLHAGTVGESACAAAGHPLAGPGGCAAPLALAGRRRAIA